MENPSERCGRILRRGITYVVVGWWLGSWSTETRIRTGEVVGTEEDDIILYKGPSIQGREGKGEDGLIRGREDEFGGKGGGNLSTGSA